VFLKSEIIGKNEENGLYSQNILNMFTIIFDRQIQTMYLACNRVKNIVKVGGGDGVGDGGGTGVDNSQIYSTRNLSRLHVGGLHIQRSDVGVPCWSPQRPNVLSSDQRITNAATTTNNLYRVFQKQLYNFQSV
jgi:hypothetical protein